MFPILADSARVETGRLLVELIGASFEIPAGWIGRVSSSSGPTCDLKSAQARSLNTERAALRTMTGPSAYFGDQYYSAFADSAFSVGALAAHLGALGWRNCDNTVNDLQVRVYVSDATPEQISQRIPQIRLSSYAGYSIPKSEAPRDSAGWRIEQVNWGFNCGDCSFPERFEIRSRRVGARTLSLVFMYTPTNAIEDGRVQRVQRVMDMQTLLQSLAVEPRGGI